MQQGLLVKDVEFAVTLLGCFALMLLEKSAVKWLLLIPLLIVASAVRYNSMPAVVPIIYLVILELTGPQNCTVAQRRLYLIIALLLSIVLPPTIQRAVSYAVNASNRYAVAELYLFDIVGTAVHVGSTPPIPQEIRRQEISLETLPNFYTPESSYPLVSGNSPLLRPTEEKTVTNLRSISINYILAHPIAYLKHRYLCAIFLLTFNHSQEQLLFREQSVANGFDYEVKPHPWREWIRTSYKSLSSRAAVDGWIALFLCIATAFSQIAVQKQSLHATAIRALAWSGLLYLASLLVVGVGSDPRYLFWPWIAGIVSFASLICTASLREVHRSN